MNDAILIGSDGLGSPDQKLGEILLGNFLRILGDRETLPKYIILWHGGVKTAARGSDTLGFLQTLEQRGVEIVICRTCVEFYGIEDEIAVGKVDGMVRMLDIMGSNSVLTV